MEIRPRPFKRGDSLEHFDGVLVGGIGAFSKACVAGKHLNEALEVVLVQGSSQEGFQARIGDSKHRLYEGPLTQAEVSFTLEVFQTNSGGDVLKSLQKDSRALRLSAKKSLRDFILEMVSKENVEGALLYVKGVANELHLYGHTDTKKLNDETKTFDHPKGPQGIEGWGNLSFIDGRTPFIHIHGVYEAYGKRKGGHFIMDDKTSLMLEKAELIIFPIPQLVRVMEKEDFPTWRI